MISDNVKADVRLEEDLLDFSVTDGALGTASAGQQDNCLRGTAAEWQTSDVAQSQETVSRVGGGHAVEVLQTVLEHFAVVEDLAVNRVRVGGA